MKHPGGAAPEGALSSGRPLPSACCRCRLAPMPDAVTAPYLRLEPGLAGAEAAPRYARRRDSGYRCSPHSFRAPSIDHIFISCPCWTASRDSADIACRARTHVVKDFERLAPRYPALKLRIRATRCADDDCRREPIADVTIAPASDRCCCSSVRARSALRRRLYRRSPAARTEEA